MSIRRDSLAVLACCLAHLAGCPSDGGSTGDGAQGSETTANGSGPSSTSMSNASTGPQADSGSTSPGGTDSTSGGGQTTMNPDSSGGGDEVMAFRFTSLYVREPHFFVGLGNCNDITDMGTNILGNDVPAVNRLFNEAINNADGDFLDLSLVLVFRPLDQSDGAEGSLDFANATCPVPAATTTCDLLADTPAYPAAYTSMAAGTCQAPVAADLSSQNYDPPPGTTTGPCFLAGPSPVVIYTSFAELPLEMATVSAQYVGDPATGLVQGTLRGFLSEETANAAMLPADFQLLVQTISDLLPGGEGCCANHDDRDGAGWWFYADFSALQVPWTGA